MTSLMIAALALFASPGAIAPAQQEVQVRLDSAAQEIVLTVGPIEIPPAGVYGHHGNEKYHVFRWPSSGWMRGYRVDLVDSTGALLPRALLHHAGMANLDRRQVAYSMAERTIASAHETEPLTLPGSLGLPLSAGQEMSLYHALVNPGERPIRASLRVRIRWSDGGTSGVRGVLPFYASAKQDTRESISFDIPAGRSETSAEFVLPAGGWLRAVGGHLHDHGVELRLEDAGSNEVLARVRSTRMSDGRLVRISQTRFLLKRRGLRLEAGRRYRVVAVYDNPTGTVLPMGAMGFLAGAFIPDDASAFERAGAGDVAFARDVQALRGGRPPATTAAHAHH